MLFMHVLDSGPQVVIQGPKPALIGTAVRQKGLKSVLAVVVVPAFDGRGGKFSGLAIGEKVCFFSGIPEKGFFALSGIPATIDQGHDDGVFHQPYALFFIFGH